MFGQQNATVTNIYVSDEQTRNNFGSLNLVNPQTASHRGWFETNSSENHRVGGGLFRYDATFTANYLENLDEGNVVTVQQDQIAQESSITSQNWFIEKVRYVTGFTHNNHRLRRIKLFLKKEF